MTQPHEKVAQALRTVTQGVRERPATPGQHAAQLAALEQAIAGSARAAGPRRPGRWFALAAALVATVGLGAWRLSQSAEGPRTSTPRGPFEVTQAQVLTPRAGVTVRTSGARLEFVDDATVRVLRGEVAAEIVAGSAPVFFESGPLVASTRGAKLTLAATGGCQGGPRLLVESGAVDVGGAELEGPAEWPLCHLENAAPAAVGAHAALVAVSTPPVEPRTSKPDASVTPVVPAPSTPSSRLSAQNQLYLDALTLQQQGKVGAAVAKLDEILSDADSPLAEAALAQKMKWLAPSDPSRAKATAAVYLQRFPRGFARAEAENLVLPK